MNININIGVSNHHVHLTEEDFKILFGEDSKLEVVSYLNQPGEFASNCVVALKTEKSTIEGVRVLGPIRKYTQIEISKTDAYKLGLKPPVRESGDIIGSEPVTIVGPNGTVEKSEGCIIASRHIHATKEDLEKYGLDENKKYLVKIGGIKGGILSQVSVKASDNYYYEMHIDTDDANAHLIDKNNCIGEIIGEDNE